MILLIVQAMGLRLDNTELTGVKTTEVWINPGRNKNHYENVKLRVDDKLNICYSDTKNGIWKGEL